MPENDADRWERPWIECEADAVEEAAHSAYEGIMEESNTLDLERFEWITRYEAENYNIENRLDDVRKETQEKASLVVPKSFVERSTDTGTEDDQDV